MSKMSEFSQVLDNMATCGKALVSTANTLKDFCENLLQCGNTLLDTATSIKDFYSSISEDAKEIPVPTKKAQITKKEAETAPTYKLEDVRAILSAKSKAGYREQVKALITKRGVDNLTQIDASEYASLVAEVEALDG